MEILLVEDYEGFVEAASAALSLRGLPVTKVARTSSEALAAIDDVAFDAVITDYDLGWGSATGQDVARHAIDSGVPCVILWSSVGRESELRGDPLMSEPDFHLMEKPWTGDRGATLAKVSKLIAEVGE